MLAIFLWRDAAWPPRRHFRGTLINSEVGSCFFSAVIADVHALNRDEGGRSSLEFEIMVVDSMEIEVMRVGVEMTVNFFIENFY